MSSAPKNNKEILLLTSIGIFSAYYSLGKWSDETPDHPKEYDGPVWVCCDDIFQIEIEETPEGDFCDALGWLPRDSLPSEPNS
jgi:hypothetical protein